MNAGGKQRALPSQMICREVLTGIAFTLTRNVYFIFFSYIHYEFNIILPISPDKQQCWYSENIPKHIIEYPTNFYLTG